ncbi:MAG TPA: NHL repeat-containing protein [Solirubrobacteraceae bacterium]|nr:NHL repeat-containing protein [Solirubrobacteraceae bacterium]
MFRPARLAVLAWALAAGGTGAANLADASTVPGSADPLPPQMSAACDLTYADLAGYCGDGGPLADARLAAPRDVAVLPDGDLLVADGQNSVIREVSAADQTISTVAGIGIVGDGPPSHPVAVGGLALADPRGVAALPDGSFAVADPGLRAVVLVSPDGLVRTLLDHRTVTQPIGVTALGSGTLAVADASADRVLEVDLATGRTQALATGLAEPWDLTPDPSVPGGLIVSEAAASPRTSQDGRSIGDVIRLGPDGTRTVIAGPGAPGAAGKLRFDRVAGLATRSDGAILVADRHVVYEIDPDGTVARLVGDLGQAEGIAVVGDELAIADSANNRIIEVPDFLPEAGPPCEDCAASAPPPPVGHSQPLPAVPTTQAPGAPVCNQGTLPLGIKALQSVAGKHGRPSTIHVNFTLTGWLQVTLAHSAGGAERSIYKKYIAHAPVHGTVSVSTGQHGNWYVRVRAPGGCHQTTRPFRL